MSVWLLPLGVTLALYVVLVIGLVVAGRRSDARAVMGFVPDCLVLFRRLLGDPRVSRASKVLVMMMIGYLAFPIDLVPDVIPVAGQLDDAVLVIWTLRSVLRASGPAMLREHWPGPASSLNALTRLTCRPS